MFRKKTIGVLLLFIILGCSAVLIKVKSDGDVDIRTNQRDSADGDVELFKRDSTKVSNKRKQLN